jgi:oligopeptide transport system substrate-binding protein
LIIDRQSIVNAVSSPGTAIADREIDPNVTYDNEKIADKYKASTNIPAAGDVNKAKEYLDKALKELGVASAAELPEITYVCMDSGTHKSIAEALQEQWKTKLGVEVKISILPVPQAIGALLSGQFDIFMLSTSTNINPVDDLTGWMIGNGNNYANWGNQEYTDAVNDLLNTSDWNDRLTKLAKAEQMLLDSAAVAPLWLPGTAYLCHDYVKDLYYGQETGSIEFIYSYISE